MRRITAPIAPLATALALAPACATGPIRAPSTAAAGRSPHAREPAADPVAIASLLGPTGSPRSDAQLAQVAQLFRRIERDPAAWLRAVAQHGDPGARATTTRTIAWLVRSPDLTISVQPWVGEWLGSSPTPEKGLVLFGAMLGMASFEIEHHAEHLDPASHAVQLAGVDASVRWYRAVFGRYNAPSAAAERELLDAATRGTTSAWLAAHTPAAVPAEPAPSTPPPPGCESAHTTFPPATDAQGRALARWVAPPDDAVANEGDALEHEAERTHGAVPPELDARMRTWAAAHADHAYGPWIEGHALLGAHDYVGARRALERAVQLRPGFVEAEYDLGVLSSAVHGDDEALAHFERAAALEPAFGNAHFNAGLLRYMARVFDGALDHWCAARRLDMDDFETARKVVQALLALDRFDDAERARAAARDLHARSRDAAVRARDHYVIDQFDVGDVHVQANEMVGAADPDLQYVYRFDCLHDGQWIRTMTLETSPVYREHGVAAAVGIDTPRGSHLSTRWTFATMPSYATLRPVVVEAIRATERSHTYDVDPSSPQRH